MGRFRAAFFFVGTRARRRWLFCLACGADHCWRSGSSWIGNEQKIRFPPPQCSRLPNLGSLKKKALGISLRDLRGSISFLGRTAIYFDVRLTDSWVRRWSYLF